jgi:hypothetical protein
MHPYKLNQLLNRQDQNNHFMPFLSWHIITFRRKRYKNGMDIFQPLIYINSTLLLKIYYKKLDLKIGWDAFYNPGI